MRRPAARVQVQAELRQLRLDDDGLGDHQVTPGGAAQGRLARLPQGPQLGPADPGRLTKSAVS
jgi:hypothetical protein